MSNTVVRVLGLSAVSLLATAAYAQGPDAAPPAGAPVHGPGPGFAFGPGPFERMELMGVGGFHGGKVVTGAPFSASAVSEAKQTLSDGTVISRKTTTNLYRDAQGRLRKEVTGPAIGPMAASGGPKTFVLIEDPSTKTGYVLDTENKVAHKLPQHGRPGEHTPKPDEAKGPENDPNLHTDSLGTQVINGLSVQGTRYTRTIPAGQVGNDKPITIVREEWYSPDLQIVVQSKHSDPFMGETTYTVSNIQRAAPNAALFTVPSDYTVSDAPPRGPHRGAKRGGGTPAPPEGM
ncbi:MAG TPA: hypothetical protein VMT51_06520 [Dongiaceae bacterium]|nr:hypothetical protein [Dongiaceae bacterium]